MTTCLARMMAVALLGAVLTSHAQTIQQAVRQATERTLDEWLAPACLQQMLNEDSVENWSVSNEAQQFAAVRKPVQLPPWTRKRIVQAFPVDPRAVPSMTVSTTQSS